MPFFSDFSQQRLLSCSYFVKKHLFSEKHAFYVHILCQKIPILSKTQCSLLIFFQIYYEKPQLSCPHLVNKTSIQTKLKYIMGQKVNKMPFFTTFHEKTMLSCLYVILKRPFFEKKTLHNCPYFTNKTSFLSKIQFSHDIFVEILMKNLLLSRSNLVKKSILSKPHYIIDKKK